MSGSRVFAKETGLGPYVFKKAHSYGWGELLETIQTLSRTLPKQAHPGVCFGIQLIEATLVD